jgi:hypothetical protein
MTTFLHKRGMELYNIIILSITFETLKLGYLHLSIHDKQMGNLRVVYQDVIIMTEDIKTMLRLPSTRRHNG